MADVDLAVILADGDYLKREGDALVGAAAGTGEPGPAGPAGATGATGATGVGVPAGGAAGTILAKTTAADYATGWITAPTGGGASVYYGNGVRAPWSELPGGVPGRAVYWGATGASTGTLGFVHVLPFMVQPGETMTFSRFKCQVDTPAASSKLHVAVYAATSYDPTAPITKVVATDAANIDCATAGAKNVTLGAPVTLPAGRYFLVWVNSGALATYFGNSVGMGWRTADVTAGNSSGTETTWVIAGGQSSLPASFPSTANAGSAGAAVIVTMHA